MSVKALLVLLFILVVLLLGAILLFILLRAKTQKQISKQPKTQTQIPTVTLKSLLEIVSDKNSSKNELFNALKIFANDFAIPPKINNKVPNEAKEYLNFILLLASHKNADAKLIAFMNNELKKKNPQYASEIEIYEEQGRSRRK